MGYIKCFILNHQMQMLFLRLIAKYRHTYRREGWLGLAGWLAGWDWPAGWDGPAGQLAGTGRLARTGWLAGIGQLAGWAGTDWLAG